MNQKQEAMKYLNNLRIKSYIVLSVLIGLVIATFLLISVLPMLFFINPLALVATGGYIYLMIKRFQFIKTVKRMLNYDSNKETIEKRVEELFSNLTSNIEDIQEQYKKRIEKLAKRSRFLFWGPRAYIRANSNTFMQNTVDYKISKKVFEIYNKKQHQ